jgi:hypothetical protein
MVEKMIKYDHCGAEANANFVITKAFDGKVFNFCCRGCLQVLELMRAKQTNHEPPADNNPE